MLIRQRAEVYFHQSIILKDKKSTFVDCIDNNQVILLVEILQIAILFANILSTITYRDISACGKL